MTKPILTCQVGSKARGLDVEGSDDDFMGIFIETPAQALGTRWKEHIDIKTEAEDSIHYSLRKAVKLLAQGNPAIIEMLFAPVVFSEPEGNELRANAHLFVSKACVPRFLGYLQSQRERLIGVRGQKDVKRPELVAKYGFDVKYAYQMVRLGFQAVELLETGSLSFPIREPDRSDLRSIREGLWTKHECVLKAKTLEDEIRKFDHGSHLPEKPDLEGIDALSARLHRGYWAKQDLRAAR